MFKFANLIVENVHTYVEYTIFYIYSGEEF